MGASLSNLEPEELVVFKGLSREGSLIQSLDIPERAENRRVTEKKWFIVILVCVALLMPFLIYSLVISDIDRLVHGYDECGNVCGKKNPLIEGFPCSGKDMTDKPYLQFNEKLENIEELTSRECVERCRGGVEPLFNRCPYQDGGSINGGSYVLNVNLAEHTWKIVLGCLASIVVTLVMLFLFRTATAAVVWGILGGVLLLGAILIGYLWYATVIYKSSAHENDIEYDSTTPTIVCVIFTVAWLVLFLVMAFMYKRIQLVVQLMKEATKAAFAMPQLLLVPVVTFLLECVVACALIVSGVYMFTSGKLEWAGVGRYALYEPGAVVVFTGVFAFWMAYWAWQFLFGVQTMVIGGAVSKWYFASNKDHLSSPVSTAAKVALRFHLGTIALGSMIISIVALIRVLLNSIMRNKTLKMCVDCLLRNLEQFIKFLTRNAFILTAMHGQPFLKSGKRAAKIILQNALNIVVINNIGDFVLAMAKLLIVLISVLITMGLMQGVEDDSPTFIYIIVGLVALIVAVTFFSIFDTTIDTIFLCFCEDSLLNDGMERPYAMSRGLMEFIENSKKVITKKN